MLYCGESTVFIISRIDCYFLYLLIYFSLSFIIIIFLNLAMTTICYITSASSYFKVDYNRFSIDLIVMDFDSVNFETLLIY